MFFLLSLYLYHTCNMPFRGPGGAWGGSSSHPGRPSDRGDTGGMLDSAWSMRLAIGASRTWLQRSREPPARPCTVIQNQ